MIVFVVIGLMVGCVLNLVLMVKVVNVGDGVMVVLVVLVFKSGSIV